MTTIIYAKRESLYLSQPKTIHCEHCNHNNIDPQKNKKGELLCEECGEALPVSTICIKRKNL